MEEDIQFQSLMVFLSADGVADLSRVRQEIGKLIRTQTIRGRTRTVSLFWDSEEGPQATNLEKPKRARMKRKGKMMNVGRNESMLTMR